MISILGVLVSIARQAPDNRTALGLRHCN